MTPLFAHQSAPLGRISGTKSGGRSRPRFEGDDEVNSPAARRSLDALGAPFGRSESSAAAPLCLSVTGSGEVGAGTANSAGSDTQDPGQGISL